MNGVRGFWPTIEERAKLDGLEIPPPAECANLPPTAWTDLQAIGFQISEVPNPATPAKLVDDRPASDGRALWIAGDHGMEAAVRPLWSIPLTHLAATEERKLRCFVSIRCKRTGDQGVAFRCGIYLHRWWEDFKTTWAELVVAADEVRDNGYQTYELGSFENLNGWVALSVRGNNSECVEGVWLDKAWLTLED